jgi:beta-glucosidase
MRTTLEQMTLEEKLAAMSGSTPFWAGLADMLSGGYNRHTWDAGKLERLGIRGIQFTDGPRGVVIGQTTTFPVSMARGATWDVALERRIGEAVGLEARAVGANLFGGVCINLLRHPAWGRAQETYGEDSFHVGEFGVALTQGVQSQQVMACVKHFALNSMENARFRVNVLATPRALHEVYLPHFKRTVEAGAACVMSAYNKVNGQWAGHSSELLTDFLKTRWGFEGFVVTDWIFGMRDSLEAVLGGQDLEMPFLMHHAQHLHRLVQQGHIPESRIDDAVGRMIKMQERFPAPPVKASVLACDEHVALAREAAQKSIVLLKNEATLPLAPQHRLALIGHLANTPNTGDGGSSQTVSPHVITPLEGIPTQFADVLYDDGSNLESAQVVAKSADVAVLVVGYTKEDEGEFVSPDATSGLRDLYPKPKTPEEVQIASAVAQGLAARAAATGAFSLGGDRRSLRLRPEDEALILAVSRVQPKTIVVLMSGSAVLMNAWQDRVAGILMLWYPGMEGGHALADVLSGAVNPSGKLPFSIAQEAEDYPFFDADASEIEYDLWHGYRKLERDGVEAAYPFGFGLSYTTYKYQNLMLENRHDVVKLSLEVHNTGAVNGEEVVQVYVAAHNSKVERAKKELKAFARVAVAAGQARLVQLEVKHADLGYFDQASNDFVLEPLEYEFIVARHSADTQALRARLRLG